MATANLDFAAQVDAWTRKATNRMDAVFKQSTQKLFSNITAELSGGLVNVQTGFLRASAQASLSEMPPIDPTAKPAAGGSYAPQFGEITATIAGAELGQTIYVGWTAAYAGLVHDGTSRTGPRPFVALPASGWQSIVSATVEEAKAVAGQP
jgi:hypothetical protein